MVEWMAQLLDIVNVLNRELPHEQQLRLAILADAAEKGISVSTSSLSS